MKTIIISASLLLSNIIVAQKLKSENVPTAVKESVTKKYPTAKVEEWEKEGENYEAELEMGKEEISVLLDTSGNILETETEIDVKDLPAAITDYISKHVKGKKIKEASKIVTSTGIVTYEAEVEKEDYIFDSNGVFLKKEK